MSLEMWHDTNEDSPTGGEEEGGVDWSLLVSLEIWHIKMRTHQLEGRKRKEWVGELRNVACHKQGLTNWRGGMGRNRLVSLEMWHNINKHSPARGEEEGGAGW